MFSDIHTLKIKDDILSKRLCDENVLDDEQILFNKVFNDDNKLQVFEYLPSLVKLSYRNFDQLKSNMNIRSLTLNLTEFQDMFTFIQHIPNLMYLNLQLEMPYEEYGQFQSTLINEIKLKEFHLKFKRSPIFGFLGYCFTSDFDQLFRVIHLFTSSLITLSLNFMDVSVIEPNDVLINGIKLENQLLKSMTKLQNFRFYVRLYGCEDIEQILPTFEAFSWPIGIHENAYLYSLPFPFHELKHFHDFKDVQSNNDEILKHNDRLWSQVTSIELILINKIDLKVLFPSIKRCMPKLSSITFSTTNEWDYYIPRKSDKSFNGIEHIDVQLTSVTTVSLQEISMKKLQNVLISSLPNFRCLILVRTGLPLEENRLMSFLGQKLQRIEMDELFLRKYSTDKRDLTFLLNLQHFKLICDITYDDKVLNSRSQIVTHLLTKLPKLEILSIYAIPFSGCLAYRSEDIFHPILERLDQDQIRTEYEIKYSGDYMWFMREKY